MQDQLRLYEELILDHNRKPRNFKKIEHPSHQAEGFNPVCGDHFWIYLNVDQDNKIVEVGFEGSGCAISKASASMMTMELKGKKIEEASRLIHQFLDLTKGKLSKDDIFALGRLGTFAGVCNYPARVKCAGLAWHTANGAINRVDTPLSNE